MRTKLKPERSTRPIPKRRRPLLLSNSYKTDPEKMKASVCDNYKADPEKKASESVCDSYKADPEKKKASECDNYIESKRSAKRR